MARLKKKVKKQKKYSCFIPNLRDVSQVSSVSRMVIGRVKVLIGEDHVHSAMTLCYWVVKGFGRCL